MDPLEAQSASMQVRIPGWASRRMRLRGGSMVGGGGGEGKERVPGAGFRVEWGKMGWCGK